MLKLREVGDELGLSRSRLLKLIAAGELQSEKRFSEQYGSERVVSRDEVERLRRERLDDLQTEKRKPGRPVKAPKLPD